VGPDSEEHVWQRGLPTRESGPGSQNYSASSIAPHPCKVRKDGPPSYRKEWATQDFR
jgi:hypothetical protein